jgi:hypothetical protein
MLGYLGEVLSPFVYLGMFELSYIGIGVVAGPGMGREKRTHFGARVLLTTLGLLAVLLFVMVQKTLPESVAIRIWLALTVAALVAAPFAWYRGPSRFPGSSDSDGPGGSGPGQPAPPSPRPRGDIPLPDADQSLVRVRDHNRPRLVDPEPRRRAREPERTPTPQR